jgi:hypothetical protein
VLYPEDLIANGVRVNPSSRICGATVTGQLHVRMNDGVYLTIKARSSAVPGRTEHADICELELAQWVISSANWGESEGPHKRRAIIPKTK